MRLAGFMYRFTNQVIPSFLDFGDQAFAGIALFSFYKHDIPNCHRIGGASSAEFQFPFQATIENLFSTFYPVPAAGRFINKSYEDRFRFDFLFQILSIISAN